MTRLNDEEKLMKRYNTISNKTKERGAIFINSFEEFKERYEMSKRDSKPIMLTFKCPECGCSFDRILPNIYKKDRSKKCGTCLKKDTMANNLVKNRNKVLKLIQDKGLNVVDISEYKNEESQLSLICKCGKIFKSTYASIRNSSKNVKCEKCKGESARLRYRVHFDKIKEMYEQEGCMLLSDEKDYVNIFSEMKFVAKCGHIHTSTIQCFKNSKFKLCEDCSKSINKGEKAYNWKGGVYNNESTKFRKTYKFKSWKKKVFKRDKYTCQCCGNYGGKLNAHHLDGYNWCTTKRVDVANGITLCKKCHEEFHHIYGYGNNTREQYNEYSKSMAKLFKLEEGNGITENYTIVLN